jgi:hypothetical protein
VSGQDLLAGLVQGGARGRDLEQHVHAVAVVLDHALDSSHLPGRALEACQALLLGFGVHLGSLYPVGVYGKPASAAGPGV